MSATAAPAQADRSDFRTVTTGGALVGVLTAVAVVAFLAASRLLPDVGGAQGGVESLIVLAAGFAVAFLPAQRTGARGVDGIAGAAAVGLVGTVVFSAIDIVLLRSFKAYPWTWDAIGGGSTWWYLPVWWMLGTFAAWMGAIVTARAATPDVPSPSPSPLVRRALPLVAATVIAVTVVRLVGLRVALPVLTGGAFTLALAALALVALARKR